MAQLTSLEEYFKPITPPSRAAQKLAYALQTFEIDLSGLTVADFGANSGGFTAIMLNAGVVQVYAVETGYGVLDWTIRNHPQVVVMERTNALHVKLPTPVDLISIDTSWTRQRRILPSAISNLKPEGTILTLVKPHYEAQPKDLIKGRLNPDKLENILAQVKLDISALGLNLILECESPITGKSSKNQEFIWMLQLGN